MSQTFFDFSAFAKIFQCPIFAQIRQNLQNEAFTIITFFANDFAISVVSISQGASLQFDGKDTTIFRLYKMGNIDCLWTI